MASVVISAVALKAAVKDKFKTTTHIELSFLQEGFALSNYIRRYEATERIEVIFSKGELQQWINIDSMTLQAIGELNLQLNINLNCSESRSIYLFA